MYHTGCRLTGCYLDSISFKIGNKIFCGDAAMNGMLSLESVTVKSYSQNKALQIKMM